MPNPAVERDCAKARCPSLYYKGFPPKVKH